MYTKLLEIQKQLLTFKKQGSNPHFKSSYLTLDDLLAKLLPVCNDLWILVYHITKDQEVKTIVTDWKDTVESSFPIWDISNPQKIGSAITYAKRYNLWQIFNIVTDDDDDWNKASVIKVVAKDETFGKENFTGKHLKSFVSALELWDWDKNIEDTIASIRAKYVLSEDHQTSVEEYHRAWKEWRLKKPTPLSK